MGLVFLFFPLINKTQQIIHKLIHMVFPTLFLFVLFPLAFCGRPLTEKEKGHTLFNTHYY